MAEGDFEKLEIYGSLMDVQYLLSVMYHNLNMEHERDDASRRHLATEEHMKTLEMEVVDESISAILDVVAHVGAGLAGRPVE